MATSKDRSSGRSGGRDTKAADATSEEAPAPTGWRAFLNPPPAPAKVPVAERERPWWGMGDMVTWFLVSQLLAGIAYVAVVSAGGYSAYWPVGPGARVGEVTGRVAIGQPPSVTRTVFDMPLWLTYAIQIPMWIGLIGGPLYVVWRKGTNLRKDFGFEMQWKDVPLGIAVGAAAQLVVVPLLYLALIPVIGEHDVSAEAVKLTDKATSPVLAIMLVVGVVLVTPIAEELFFRGLTQRSITRRAGPMVGIVGTTIFFALTHAQLLQLPGLLVFGFALSWMANRFGRLGPGIFAHMTFNAVAAVLLIGNFQIP